MLPLWACESRVPTTPQPLALRPVTRMPPAVLPPLRAACICVPPWMPLPLPLVLPCTSMAGVKASPPPALMRTAMLPAPQDPNSMPWLVLPPLAVLLLSPTRRTVPVRPASISPPSTQLMPCMLLVSVSVAWPRTTTLPPPEYRRV